MLSPSNDSFSHVIGHLLIFFRQRAYRIAVRACIAAREKIDGIALTGIRLDRILHRAICVLAIIEACEIASGLAFLLRSLFEKHSFY